MGNFQIALDPFPPSVKQANVEKSPPNQPDKPLHPPAKVGKKWPTPPPPPNGQCPKHILTYLLSDLLDMGLIIENTQH